jgi:plastocyanin
MSMRMRLTLAVILLAAAVGCSQSSSPTAPTTPTNVNATIVAGGFAPNPINISVGSTVMWTNMDTAAHSVVSDSGAFSSGTIAPGGQYSYTFPAAGTFTYHDSFNTNMTGAVNVTASSMPSPSPY